MQPRWIPARPGDALEDVDTPALVLDLDVFERNHARLMNALRPAGVRVRPHAKAHKCVELARRQVDGGAAGICVQKPGEAEVFVAAGLPDVLITNEVVGAGKLRRLAALARSFPAARLGVCVDDPGTVRALRAACAAEGAVLDVYVELDVGQDRCGVATPAAAVALARAVGTGAELNLRGLHAYLGSAQHLRPVAERRAATLRAIHLAAQARDALRAEHLECGIVTGGGTGTFVYDAASDVYNEVQPGSYALMDADYARNEADPNAPQFDPALFVLATVISLRTDSPDRARLTLDAGLKALATDAGPPVPAFPGWAVRAVSDEHTVLARDGAADTPPVMLGGKALLIPGHCDPTVNLHDWIVAVRRGRVEAVWPVDARGAVN